MSFLLVAEIPLFALKFKNFKWKGNEIRFIFLLVSLLMLVFLKFVGIPLIIVFYVLLSVANNLFGKKSKQASSEQ
jgi:CDP-diacylglycerol--serine O-phosphatidyltransferase